MRDEHMDTNFNMISNDKVSYKTILDKFQLSRVSQFHDGTEKSLKLDVCEGCLIRFLKIHLNDWVEVCLCR